MIKDSGSKTAAEEKKQRAAESLESNP